LLKKNKNEKISISFLSCQRRQAYTARLKSWKQTSLDFKKQERDYSYVSLDWKRFDGRKEKWPNHRASN